MVAARLNTERLHPGRNIRQGIGRFVCDIIAGIGMDGRHLKDGVPLRLGLPTSDRGIHGRERGGAQQGSYD